MRNTGRQVVLGATVGGALGLWNGLWIAGVLIALRDGWLLCGMQIPAQLVAFARIDPDAVLHPLFRFLPFDAPTDPPALMICCFLLGLLLGEVIGLTMGVSTIDPNGFSIRSLSWALRVFFSWPTLMICLTAMGAFSLAGVFARGTDTLWLIVPLASVALATPAIGVPLAICRVAIARCDSRPVWWIPAWPSWRVLGLFVALEAISAAVVLLDNLALSLHWVLAVCTLLLLAIAHAFLSLLQATVLLQQSTDPVLNTASLARWTRIGPWVAYGFLFFVAGLATLIGPLAAAYVVHWRLVPVLATAYEGMGLLLPVWWRLFASLVTAIGDLWWLVLPAPVAILYWLGAARLGWRLGLHQPEGVLAPNPGGPNDALKRTRPLPGSP